MLAFGPVRRTSCALLALLVCLSISASDYSPPEKAKAVDGLKKIVADAFNSGKRVDVWLTIFGSLQKVVVSKVDAKTITVKIQNNPFDQSWDKIQPEELAGVGKSCVQGDAERSLVLADYCIAAELSQKADDALNFAATANPALRPQCALRWKYLEGHKAQPVVAAPATSAPAEAAPAAAPNTNALAAAGLGGGSGSYAPSSAAGSGPAPIPAPAKIAFKPSETGKLTPVKEVASAIDNAIEIGLADMGIRPEPLCDDAAFLRRASLDITGQIPTPEEVIAFYHDGDSNKRAKKIEELLARPEYADNWTTFWDVVLIGRRTNEGPDVKPSTFRTWLRGEFEKNTPWDQIVTELLSASGDNDRIGPVNYLTEHLAGTLPTTVAHVSQTLLGARIGCAQCHDHPFDKWSQQDFWGFAAFLSHTVSERKELREDPKDPTRVTKTWHILVDTNDRQGGQKYDPPQPDLRLPAKALDGPVFTDEEAAKAASTLGKKLDGAGGGMAGGMGMDKGAKGGMDKGAKSGMDKGMGMDKSMSSAPGSAGMGMGMGMGGSGSSYGGKGQNLRRALAAWVTNPKNEKFAQSAVNRVWRAMYGYGLVEPIDDIRPKNPASYPEVMSILANEFNASGRDMKQLIRLIANTKAYQRSSLGMSQKVDRQKAVRYAARAEVRPMTPEQLFMAVLKATGGSGKVNEFIKSLHGRDEAMMSGSMDYRMGGESNYQQMMQRFIGTSTAEDRAGKLQFEGTVGQALMMMHSGFMNNAIKESMGRFKKQGMNDMVYIFAATLGRPPTPVEANAFSNFHHGLDGVMWILMNSSEFVTIH